MIMSSQVKSQQFPRIEAETLSKKQVVFPQDTQGQFALLLIAFRRQTQGEVDSWLNPFIEDFSNHQQVTFYEIPMISGNWKWMSGWIDSGMRSGVAEYKHDHVATYYGPLKSYFQHFEVDDVRRVYVFLLDKQGHILWRETGRANQNKYQELKLLLNSKVSGESG